MRSCGEGARAVSPEFSAIGVRDEDSWAMGMFRAPVMPRWSEMEFRGGRDVRTHDDIFESRRS